MFYKNFILWQSFMTLAFVDRDRRPRSIFDLPISPIFIPDDRHFSNPLARKTCKKDRENPSCHSAKLHHAVAIVIQRSSTLRAINILKNYNF